MDRPDRLTLEGIEPSLPARFYLDVDHYERELRSIWYDSWVYLCRSEDLTRRGDFRVFALGSQSILVNRGSDGGLYAFHNTCRHRGSELCSEESGRFRGSSIVCPYHQWTYSLDGRLRSTPHRLESPDFRYDDYPLYRVALEQRAGFVFVHLGTDPSPLLEAFDPGPMPLDNWHLEDLRVGHRICMLVECNWKIFWENYHECLHCPSTHPELVKIVPTYGKGLLSEHELSADGTLDSADRLTEPPLAEGAAPGLSTASRDSRPSRASAKRRSSAGRPIGRSSRASTWSPIATTRAVCGFIPAVWGARRSRWSGSSSRRCWSAKTSTSTTPPRSASASWSRTRTPVKSTSEGCVRFPTSTGSW